MSGEMQHRVDVVIAKYFREQYSVASISGDKLTTRHGGFKAGRQIVEGQNILAREAQLFHDVATDIAGSTSDQYLIVFAQVFSLVWKLIRKV